LPIVDPASFLTTESSGEHHVNKSELIDAIAKHADISKAAAGRALDATVNSIKSSLRKGDIVTLVGFGSFYVGKRTERAGRNPRTGETIRIEAAKVPKFRAGKELKDSLN
jgi:DNA-binding protein HU-beta